MMQHADPLGSRLLRTAAELRRLCSQRHLAFPALAQAARAISGDFAAIRKSLPMEGQGALSGKNNLPCRISAGHGHRDPKHLDGFDLAEMVEGMCGLGFLCTQYAQAERVVVHQDGGVLVADAHTGDGMVRLDAATVAELFETVVHLSNTGHER
jgi:hypothetical protein